MRSSNPVLTRPDAFTPGYREASYGDIGQLAGSGRGIPTNQAPSGRMTMNDVIAKTATLFVILVAVAAVTWIATPVGLLFPVAIVSSVVALVAAIMVTVRRSISVPAIVFYTVAEGVLIGAWSSLMEFLYPGIVSQAVLGTFVAAAVTLACYRYLGVRVAGRMRKILVISVIAYAVLAALNLVLFLFGAFYLARYWHRTTVPDCKGCEQDDPRVSDRAAILGLVALLAASPGEVLLPIYLSASTQGWGVFAVLTGGFWLGTIVGMLAFTLLAMAGYSVLRLERWARYEGIVLGVSLILLGFLMAFHVT